MFCCLSDSSIKDQMIYMGSLEANITVGEEAFWSQDYIKAFGHMSQLWDNVPRAQALAGIMYEHGLGVNSDLKKALVFYEKASEGGDALASYALYCYYVSGLFFSSVDYQKAIQLKEKALHQGWNAEEERLKAKQSPVASFYFGLSATGGESQNYWRQAAKGNFTKAQVILGNMLLQMGSNTVEMEDGHRLLLAAQERGDLDASCLLATRLKDKSKSLEALRKLADEGHAGAMLFVFEMESKTGKISSKARKYLEASAAMNYDGSLLKLADCLKLGQHGFQKDLMKAKEFYLRAGHQGRGLGYTRAAEILLEELSTGECDFNQICEQAGQNLHKAMELEDGAGAYLYANLVLDGFFDVEDRQEAAKQALQLCALNVLDYPKGFFKELGRTVKVEDKHECVLTRKQSI